MVRIYIHVHVHQDGDKNSCSIELNAHKDSSVTMEQPNSVKPSEYLKLLLTPIPAASLDKLATTSWGLCSFIAYPTSLSFLSFVVFSCRSQHCPVYPLVCEHDPPTLSQPNTLSTQHSLNPTLSQPDRPSTDYQQTYQCQQSGVMWSKFIWWYLTFG